MNDTFRLDGAARLDHWGVIRARGVDAARFLQSQLTNDVASLGPGRARLAGFCSAKGRLQASFVVWQAAEDEVMLACSAGVLPSTLKRLSMFVLRAQCKLSDASGDIALWGAAGETARGLTGAGFDVWEKREVEGATLIRLPDVAGQARCLWLKAPANSGGTPPWPALSLDNWRWLEVQSGLATIEAATVDQFVPQMINYELVGAVDFQKGCYPGQEVVARSQYRGTVKRRSFLFDCDAQAAPGQEVFHSADPGQPAGLVVNAAPRPDAAGASALVEVKLASLDGGSLHLGAPGGALLRRADMPYTVPLETALPA